MTVPSSPTPTPAPGSSASPASLPSLLLGLPHYWRPVLGTVASSGVQGRGQLEVLQAETVVVSAIDPCVWGGPGRPRAGRHGLQGRHWHGWRSPAHWLVGIGDVDVVLTGGHLLCGPEGPGTAEGLYEGGDMAAGGVCP